MTQKIFKRCQRERVDYRVEERDVEVEHPVWRTVRRNEEPVSPCDFRTSRRKSRKHPSSVDNGRILYVVDFEAEIRENNEFIEESI